MKKLDPDQRRLLKLVFFDGVKQKDIAKAEGVSPQSVNIRLSLILKKLKDALSD